MVNTPNQEKRQDKIVTSAQPNKISKTSNSEGNIKTQGLRQKLVNKVKSWNNKETKDIQANSIPTPNPVRHGNDNEIITKIATQDS